VASTAAKTFIVLVFQESYGTMHGTRKIFLSFFVNRVMRQWDLTCLVLAVITGRRGWRFATGENRAGCREISGLAIIKIIATGETARHDRMP